jgi:hypothetical protein
MKPDSQTNLRPWAIVCIALGPIVACLSFLFVFGVSYLERNPYTACMQQHEREIEFDPSELDSGMLPGVIDAEWRWWPTGTHCVIQLGTRTMTFAPSWTLSAIFVSGFAGATATVAGGAFLRRR